MAFEGNTWFNYVVYSIFAIIAFLGNSLVIYVLVVRKRSFLKKPYCMFIFNLAVIDCITAIFLVFSRFLYLPPVPNNSLGEAEAYCRTIWSATILFSLGYVSIYTCLMLTIERWLAVVKPLTYRSVKPKHAIIAVVFVWIWGFALNTTTLFRATYNVAKKQCMWTATPVANEELPWMDFTLQSLIPFISMVFMYIHIYHTMKNRPKFANAAANQLKKITIIALAASSALIIGWLPGRITFMLTKFSILDANGIIHTTCAALTFLNSCVNPILYGIYSSQFREEYIIIFKKIWAGLRGRSTSSSVASAPADNSGDLSMA